MFHFLNFYFLIIQENTKKIFQIFNIQSYFDNINFLNISLPRKYNIDLPTTAFFLSNDIFIYIINLLRRNVSFFLRGKLLIEEVYFLTPICDINLINFRFLYCALKFSVFVSFSKIRYIFCMSKVNIFHLCKS